MGHEVSQTGVSDELDIGVSGNGIFPERLEISSEITRRNDDVWRESSDGGGILERLGPKAQITVNAKSVVLQKAIFVGKRESGGDTASHKSYMRTVSICKIKLHDQINAIDSRGGEKPK